MAIVGFYIATALTSFVLGAVFGMAALVAATKERRETNGDAENQSSEAWKADRG